MPSTPIRQQLIASARRVVVKMGTQLLTGKDGRLDLPFLGEIARQVVALRAKGLEVTIVSSGAIGAGVAELGLPRRPRDVTDQQAVAAVGQRRLMTHMHEAFEPHGLKVAQLLLTRGDFDDRLRFLNIRNCIARLHQLNCVPIINENDTVAVEELRFGDNDMLAALVANGLRADALVLLTVVPGLLDEAGSVVEMVEGVSNVLNLARAEKSALGTGGIKSKLEAARLLTEAGEAAVIASGREPDVLLKLFGATPYGQPVKVGTVFIPATRKLDSRQRWIGLTKRPAGTVTVDDGAAEALVKRNKSLLATGIVETTGGFERGEVVLVRDTQGRELARGLTNYSADEMRLVMGHKSSSFEKILGRPGYAEVIHRDNLVVTANASG